jgi:subtilisin family serine protease
MKDPKGGIRHREDTATPVIGVGNSAWVRPGELLVERKAEKEFERELLERGGQPYNPRVHKEDWRNGPDVPASGDINRRLRRAGLPYRLWVGFSIRDQLELINKNEGRGLHFNHVFFGEDFYQGGPGGPPAAVVGPLTGLVLSGDDQVDVAVLDTGLPANWKTVHLDLATNVDEVGMGRVPTDPLDQDHDNNLDAQAGHGLFISGLIARMAATLDIQLSRVLSSTGECSDDQLTAALNESTAQVINLSLGCYTDNDQEPVLLAPIVRRMVTDGTVIVAAAGNAGGINKDSVQYDRPFWPASMPEVVSVGALDTTTCEGDPKPWTTNDPDIGTNAGKVYAPGVDLLSTYIQEAQWPQFQGWAKWTGTSFATPLVAAAIAEQLIAQNAVSSDQVVQQWLDDLDDHPWGDVPAGKVYLPPNPVTEW